MADVDRLVALDRQMGLLSLVMWGSTGVCLDALPPGPCVKHHRRVGKMSVAQARRSSVLDRLLCMHDTPAVTAAGGKHLAPFSAALRVGAQISALECLQAWLGLLLSKCGPFASLPGTSRQLVGLMSLGRCSCSHTAATALQQHLVQAKNPFGLPASHPVPPPPPPRVQCCACLCCGRRSATPATCAGVRPPWQPCGSPSWPCHSSTAPGWSMHWRPCWPPAALPACSTCTRFSMVCFSLTAVPLLCVQPVLL